MLRSKKIRNPVEGVIVNENSTEQRLLRLDVVRRQAESRIGTGGEAGSFGKSFEGWHGLLDWRGIAP